MRSFGRSVRETPSPTNPAARPLESSHDPAVSPPLRLEGIFRRAIAPAFAGVTRFNCQSPHLSPITLGLE